MFRVGAVATKNDVAVGQEGSYLWAGEDVVDATGGSGGETGEAKRARMNAAKAVNIASLLQEINASFSKGGANDVERLFGKGATEHDGGGGAHAQAAQGGTDAAFAQVRGVA